jgi:OST-HTH/LOTUS domain
MHTACVMFMCILTTLAFGYKKLLSLYFTASIKPQIMENLVEITKILKNLCVSSQQEMTVGQLAKEYTSQTGKNLNYNDYGCYTLTEMIRSMKDTFRVVKV